MKRITIQSIQAYEILSSGALPTLEVKIMLSNNVCSKASVPFGASSGSREACTLVDHDAKRYNGKGMLKASSIINKKIAPMLVGSDIFDQRAIDKKMIDLDGTENKTKLGGNSMLAVSLACARAASEAKKTPLWKYLQSTFHLSSSKMLPQPMMVLIEGGVHADNSTDFQEYLVVSRNNNAKPSENIRKIIEVYHALKDVLHRAKLNTNVGNEGAYAPQGITNNEAPLKYIMRAITRAGYAPGKDLALSLDVAASEMQKKNFYYLKKEKKSLRAGKLIQYYCRLIKKYPILSIEDGLSENDWENWKILYQKIHMKTLVIGDDLTTTKQSMIHKFAQTAINAVIIKPNQIGTLSETIEAIKEAQNNSCDIIVSHRGGGETNDTSIIDIAVAGNARFVKVGPSRGERVEKYNRLMEIERQEIKQ